MGIKFLTESESTYEVDPDKMMIRRLSGVKEPSDRQGPDGVFKRYGFISEIEIGKSVVILWENEDADSDIFRMTRTSHVTQLEN